MRTKLEQAHDISSIGTFVLTIVIVVFMVIPMVWPSGTQPIPGIATPVGHPMIAWLMPSILACAIVLAGVLHFLAARQTRQSPSSNRVESREPASPVPVPVYQAPQTPEPLPSLRTLPATNSEGRIFVGPEITPQFLSGLLAENTDIQARKLINIYIGKWMKISGAIGEVMEPLGGSCIVLLSRASAAETSVVMRFGEKWHGQLSIFRRGTNVTVEGKIQEVDWISVRLDECDLV